jgi:hypothetical protein
LVRADFRPRRNQEAWDNQTDPAMRPNRGRAVRTAERSTFGASPAE